MKPIELPTKVMYPSEVLKLLETLVSGVNSLAEDVRVLQDDILELKENNNV